MHIRRFPFVLIIGFLVLGMFFQSCLKSKNPGLPNEVVRTISETGINRVELTKTIGYFIDREDSIYLHSVYFLMKHLPHQYSVNYEIQDNDSLRLNFNPVHFQTYEELESWWKEQKLKKNGIKYVPIKYTLDRDTITATLLINTVDLAVSSTSFPWSKFYSADDYFEYILPYRFGNETLNDWRSRILHDFKWVLDSIGNQTDPTTIIKWVNSYVNNNFEFDKRYLRVPEAQSFEEIITTKRGNYQDLAYLKAMMLRSFGIPATIDYVPFLADTTGSFYFAVAKNKHGVFEALLPNETTYLFSQNYIPKVYRRIYTKNPQSLYAIKELSLTTPPFIGHYHYLDVTNEYVETKTYNFPVKKHDTLYYAAVFNDSSWRAVDWTITKTNIASFQNLSMNINYRVMHIKDDSLRFEKNSN